jgi:hypothetical protein
MPYGKGRFGWALAWMLSATPAWAQTAARPAHEAVGSWVLACPPASEEPCVLRHRDWVLPPGNGGPSAALEIQARGEWLVPVVALRGLPTGAALGGSLVAKPTVTVSLDGGKRMELGCGVSGTSYVCAPAPDAVPGLAAAFPKARVVSASIAVTVPGVIALPPREQALELAGTEVALARLRAVGASGEALPAYEGLDMQGLLDRILRDLGFPNGAADVLPSLMPFVRWFSS